MKKITVKVMARAEVLIDDGWDAFKVDQYVKDNYDSLIYPPYDFKLVGYEYEHGCIVNIGKAEGEKKYYLKLKDNTSAILGEYLNFNKSFNVYFLQNNFQCNDYQTRFTQKEIDEIKKRYNTDLEEFEQVEVE